MSRLLRVVAGLATVSAALALVWRAVRRNPRPCPARLSFVLDNPITERWAGAETLLERAGVVSGMSVLDAGCGPGRLTLPAAHRVGPTGQVVALDVQEAMLRKLRRRLTDRDVSNVRVVCGGLGEGLLGEAVFDRALLVTVLGEVPDRVAALREIYRALKPGGVLSVTEALPDPDYQSRSAIRKLAGEAGFEPAVVHGGVFAFTMNLRKPDSRDVVETP